MRKINPVEVLSVMRKRKQIKMNTNYVQINSLIYRATKLKHDLMQAGLLRTFQKMDEVTKCIGWEAAEILEDKHPTKLKSRKNKKK